MPHPWALVDSSFPTFTGEEGPQEQIGQIMEYMMLLTEALKYQLENLSSSNWNSTALKNMQANTTQDVEKNYALLSAKLAVLANELTALMVRVNGLDGYATEIEIDLKDLAARVGQTETDISYLEIFRLEATEELEQINAGLGSVEALTMELEEGQDRLQSETEKLKKAQAETTEQVVDLENQHQKTKGDVDKLIGAVTVDEKGNVRVGGEGMNVYLAGNVYINGALYEEANTE